MCTSQTGSPYSLIRRPCSTTTLAIPDTQFVFWSVNATPNGYYWIQSVLQTTTCPEYSWLKFNENDPNCITPATTTTQPTWTTDFNRVKIRMGA